jgi:hypothetical protein
MSVYCQQTRYEGTVSRRHFLSRSGLGLGGLVASLLLQERCPAAGQAKFGLTARQPPLPERVKSVILMMQNGGPSQMDMFDPKPTLQKLSGKRHDVKVETFQPGSEKNQLLGSPFDFRRRGHCGMELSDVIPNIGRVADELCLVRSMYTEHNNHTEGLIMFMTGRVFQGRPSFGSWISYGLGTCNENLPAYVVLRDAEGYNTSGTLTWSSGWLPALYGGTEFSSQGEPVLNLHPGQQVTPAVQAQKLALIRQLNRRHQKRYPGNTELESRIQNYELAARMQLAAADVLDINNETKETRSLYGLDEAKTKRYGLRCLLARKLVEAGVRFVQIHPKPTQPWDTHSNTQTALPAICQATDLPTAGLITDLKRRGLLDQTLVIWAGEFGRLPVSQNGTGRDHNRNAFSLFMAGGGVRPGFVYGETDDIGYASTTNRVSVPDLHATILHQLGIDHETLTYPHQGRDETLTDPSLTGASVVEDILQ